MENAITLLTDSPDSRVMGNPDRGCRHCGRVEMKYSENGKVTLYHPGVECCAAAYTDQIGYRMGEIRRFEKQLSDRQDDLNQLQAEAELYGSSRSSEASRAQIAYERALRTSDTATLPLRQKIAECAREIHRLKSRRAEVQA